jgi:uncharacterized protein (TIGR03435 family)
MTLRVARTPDERRKPLLRVVGVLAVATELVIGISHATQSWAQSQTQDIAAASLVYEVASIKPNNSGSDRQRILLPPDGFKATNVTLHMLIRVAYGVEDNQISDEPKWVKSENYDVEAKIDTSVADTLRKLGEDQRKLERQRMLQALLADRFKLTLRRETKELPVYALILGKGRPRLQKANYDSYPNGEPDYTVLRRGSITAQAVSMADLAKALTHLLGRSVLDKTGLKGNYDFTLQWTPDESEPFKRIAADSGVPGSAPQLDSLGASVFTAIQEQLGLRLDSQKAPVDVLVIDHVEKPSEN